MVVATDQIVRATLNGAEHELDVLEISARNGELQVYGHVMREPTQSAASSSNGAAASRWIRDRCRTAASSARVADVESCRKELARQCAMIWRVISPLVNT